MKHTERHLSPEELVNVLSDEHSADKGIVASREHVAHCLQCQQAITRFSQIDDEWRRIAPRPPESTRACPPAVVWYKIAGGVPSDRDRSLLAHVAECSLCSARLQAAQQDLQTPVSSEEADMLPPPPVRPVCPVPRHTWATVLSAWQWQWQFAAAVASLAIVLVGIGYYLERRTERPVERLLAEAYTERRRFEWRLPDAGHAAVRISRDAVRSSFDRPTALLDAESHIKRAIDAKPEDVSWLRLRARTEMLNWEYSAAISTLERARELAPSDTRVVYELGCAQALKGDAEKDWRAYSEALDLFSRARAADPKNAIILFNRALVLERLTLYDQAAAAWQEYLNLDKQGAWADEARTHFSSVTEKKTRVR